MIFDLHNDVVIELDALQLMEYIKSNSKHIINFAIFTTKLKDTMFTIESKVNFLKKNVKNVLWSVEDLGFIDKENFTVYTDKLIDLKPFCCSITWNYSNVLGGGALSDDNLKPLGKRVIRKLESKKILIDTAHLNEKSFYSFADITSRPIINTHSCFYDLCPNPRNIKHKQIEQIVQSNGLIGLTLVSFFLSNNKEVSITDVTNHIDYFVQRFGCKNLCIGTDFYGANKFPKNLENYYHFKNLQYLLTKKGYTLNDINKIFYKNAIDFLSRLYP